MLKYVGQLSQVFFPVVSRMYNYLILFNLKTPDVLVMDSDDREGEVTDLYEMHVHILVNMLSS